MGFIARGGSNPPSDTITRPHRADEKREGARRVSFLDATLEPISLGECSTR